MTIYSAWQEHEAVTIAYLDVGDKATSRMVEPHSLVYYECAWYIKCHCLLRNQVRNFAVHRIVKAKPSGKFFDPDHRIIAGVLNGHFLEYSEVSDISVRCVNAIRNYVLSNPLANNQHLTSDCSGHFILFIPTMPEHEIIQWILFQGGNVELLEPARLRGKIVEAAQKIVKKHT